MSLVTTNKADLVGEFSWEQWLELSGWDIRTIEEIKSKYNPNDVLFNQLIEKINNLTNNENNLNCVLFAGSWCGDTYEQMPKIIKILEKVSYPTNNFYFKIIGVSRDKTEPSKDISQFNVKFLPTLILNNNNKEIGRIIEHPITSWEYDILNFIK